MEAFRQWFVAIAGAVSLLLLGILVNQLFDLSETAGQHTERFTSLSNDISDIKSDIAELGLSQFGRFDKLDADVDQLRKMVDVRDVDLGQMLATMGVVESGDIFQAAFHDGSVWVFPASAEASQRLVDRGLRREPLNSAVAGFRIMPIANVSVEQQ